MANQVIWAVRSDNSSFDARYSPVARTPGLAFSTSAGATPVYEADAAAIGGNRFNMGTTAALARNLTYRGRGIFNTNTISVLIRARVLSSALVGMFDITNGSPLQTNRFALYQNSSAWKSFITDKNGVVVANSAALVTQAPTTTVYQDFVVTWDGTTGANKIMFWIDGVNVGNATATGAWANPQDSNLTDSINIGGVFGGVGNVHMYVNEMVIWNYVIDPTNVALVSGTASLNGTSRTSFVDVASFDGSANTDPGIANVRLSTAYTIAGVPLTGTAAIPTAADTKTGVAVDATTGSYDGSDRWTDPGAANVRNGTAYKANSTSNNQTGSASIPVANNVRSGVATDATTGNLSVPIAAEVKTGVTFESSAGQTGTYDGSDRWTDPGAANVRLGTAYQANSVTNNQTGSAAIPTAGNVRLGVATDATTGTLESTDPGIANVSNGIAYKINSTPLTGVRTITEIRLASAKLTGQGDS